MLFDDLLGPLAADLTALHAHAGLVAFTLISMALFAYLLYRMIYPERG